MMRGILGVLAGYAIFAGSVLGYFHALGIDPHEPATARVMLASVSFGVITALLAGYVSAFIAERHGHETAKVLGAAIALIALISLFMRRHEAAAWSQISAALLMAPAVVAGGFLRVIQCQRIDEQRRRRRAVL